MLARSRASCAALRRSARAALGAALDAPRRAPAPATSVTSRQAGGGRLASSARRSGSGRAATPSTTACAGRVRRRRRRRRPAWWRGAAVLAGGAGERGGRVAQRGGVERRPGRRRRRRRRVGPSRRGTTQRLADLAVEAEAGERRPVEAELARHGALSPTGTPTTPASRGPTGRRRPSTSPVRASDGVGLKLATAGVITSSVCPSVGRRRALGSVEPSAASCQRAIVHSRSDSRFR